MNLDPYPAQCPTCGADAVWTGAPVGLGGANGTDYRLFCSRCDVPVDLTRKADRMSQIVDFILERLAEDERQAMAPTVAVAARNGLVAWDDGGELMLIVSRHRVLAECDAKRRIIELHQRHEDDAQFDRWNHAEKRMEWRCGAACQECGHIDENPIEWPCPTLRLLSLPFRDHPSYRPEWAPE